MNVADPGPLTRSLKAALLLHEKSAYRLDGLREVNGWMSDYFRSEDYMPRAGMTTTQTAAVATQVTLEPQVQAQLEGNLSTYNELKAQAAMIAEAMDTEKAAIREMMEVNGAESLTVGNCTLRMVRGVTNTVDWKRLHGDGIISEAQKENYTVTKPKRAYLDIRGVGDE